MNTIEFKNYRCYSHLKLEFGEQITILFGENASGKTTILRGLRAAMSAFFAGFSDDNTRFFGITKDDFTKLSQDDVTLFYQPVSIGFISHNSIEYPELLTPSLLPIDFIGAQLEKESPKNNRTLVTGIKELKQYSAKLFKTTFDLESKTQVKSLPLFAAFSTEDIHSSRKLNIKQFKEYNQRPSFGYFECLFGDGFLNYWIKRLIVLEEGQKSLSEITCVKQQLMRVLGPEGCNILTDISVRPQKGEVYFTLSDGREVESSVLSDGHARLINIVMDLAFRCMILNKGIYNGESCERTVGTVLIDEIDLHLHPRLQSRILPALCSAFPKLQFIVTTHAPMVLSGVDTTSEGVTETLESFTDKTTGTTQRVKTRVYKLSYDKEQGYQVLPASTYGLDASAILKMEMDVEPRDEKMQQRLNEIRELIDGDEYKKARPMIDNLRTKYGDSIPEISEMEAMLNFHIDMDEED